MRRHRQELARLAHLVDDGLATRPCALRRACLGPINVGPVTVPDVISRGVIRETVSEGLTTVPSVGEINDYSDKKFAAEIGALARTARDQGRRSVMSIVSAGSEMAARASGTLG